MTAGHRPGGAGGSSGQAHNTRATCICQNMLSPDHSLQRWKNWNPGRRGLPLGPTASQRQPGTWSWLPLAFPTLAAELAPSQPSSSVLESRSISCLRRGGWRGEGWVRIAREEERKGGEGAIPGRENGVNRDQGDTRSGRDEGPGSWAGDPLLISFTSMCERQWDMLQSPLWE